MKKLFAFIVIATIGYFGYRWYNASPTCDLIEDKCLNAAAAQSDVPYETAAGICTKMKNKCLDQCDQNPYECTQLYNQLKNTPQNGRLFISTSHTDPCKDILEKCQALVKAGSLPATVDGKDKCTQLVASCNDKYQQ